MTYRKGKASIDTDYDTDYEPKLAIMLPHSCDEWIIGGVEEAKTLIADLEALIPELEKRLEVQS